MGLVFPLQVDLRRSRPETLVLSSTTKRFTVGGSFLFIGLVLAAMYLAAAPLFDIMWKQGEFFDKALAAFFYAIAFAYPIVTLVCWFYKSTVTFEIRNGKMEIHTSKNLGPIAWGRAHYAASRLEDLEVDNWKGAVNVASVAAEKKGRQDRYATRGHWMLKLKSHPGAVLERRAKREDIDWLKAQIEAFFQTPPSQT
jgi:hypothetical protein